MPSMEQMKQDHQRYGHHGQAATIVAELRGTFPALEITDPQEVESGRYIAVYVTLVPEMVRMRIHLTSSGLDQHSYNLEPITETVADRQRFIDHMARNHPSIALKKDGFYAKLPGWTRANVKNNDHAAISGHVRRALKVLTASA